MKFIVYSGQGEAFVTTPEHESVTLASVYLDVLGPECLVVHCVKVVH